MKKIFIVLLLLHATLYIFAQDIAGVQDGINTEIVSKKSRPAYIDITVGIQFSTFRDFATSPLFYDGTPIFVSLSHIDMDANRESGFRLSYAFGSFESEVEHNVAMSKVRTVAINYVELFELHRYSNSKFNLKLGGQVNAIANIRDNESFGNNSDGFEVIANLFGSIKGTLDISRDQGRPKKNLAFGLHIGLINTSYRNGFIYTRQSPLLNQDNINDGYAFQFFKGYRINSSLDYSFWLKNGNAVQLSYWWDIYKTGGADTYEMAAHLLKLSLLFNLK